MSSIVTYNFKPHRAGDTFNGLQLTYTVNDAPVDLSEASIRLQLRRSVTDKRVALRLDTDNGGIVITDATAGQFTIPAQIVNIAPAVYVHDLEITLANGTRKTRMVGEWPIVADISRRIAAQ